MSGAGTGDVRRNGKVTFLIPTHTMVENRYVVTILEFVECCPAICTLDQTRYKVKCCLPSFMAWSNHQLELQQTAHALAVAPTRHTRHTGCVDPSQQLHRQEFELHQQEFELHHSCCHCLLQSIERTDLTVQDY
jgi:hypothetical protein